MQIDTNKTINQLHIEQSSIGNRVADSIAAFVGSWRCIGLHTLWFTLWFVLRLDINLLTLIVSLEAIFLCAFIMISQNRQADKDHIAAEHSYAVNDAAKVEIEQLIKLVIVQNDHLNQQDKMILQIVKRLETQQCNLMM